MTKDRKAATEYILKNLEEILPGNSDTPRYKEFLEGLSDKAFDAYMKELQSGDKYLTLTAPNFGKVNLDLERNKRLADKLGVKLFHKLWFEGDENTPTFLTP